MIKTALPGPQSEHLAKLIANVECSGVSTVVGGRIPTFWASGHNCTLVDVDGNKFLDFTSSFGVNVLGNCHPRVVQAITNQASNLVHTMTGIFPTPAYAACLRAIQGAIGRTAAAEVLLANSGSEAVEAALKLSVRSTGRSGVLAFSGSYHGQSLGALSVTSHGFLRDSFRSILAQNVTFVPYPNAYRPGFSCMPESLVDATLSHIRRLLTDGASGAPPIGSMILEPMQNASGYIVPPPGFLKGLRALCNEFDILLVLDEVFTGCGRSGYWLMADSEDVVADIMCVGKGLSGGLPIAACVADRSLMALWKTDSMVPLHGGTFFGNPLTCAACEATIAVITDDDLVLRARSLGERCLPLLRERTADYHRIGDVRGRGLALAIECVRDRATKEPDPALALELAGELFKRGVVVLVTGLPVCNSIAICPPLNVGEADIDYFMEALEESLEVVAS